MKFIKTKLQMFAFIAWVLAVGVVSYNTYETYTQANKKSPEAKEDRKEIIENYLKAIGWTTGVCLLAWGIPAIPTSHWLFSGKPIKPFEISDSKKQTKEKA